MDEALLRKLLAEKLRRRRDEPIRYFQPHGGQEDFIRLLTEPGAFIVISGAGNGWGKSEFLAALFAAIMWPALAPACFAHPVLSQWKHPKRARIYSKPAELEEIGSLQVAIKKYFPRGRYDYANGRYRYPSVFKTDTGWVMDLFSYERDAAEAAGPNIGLQAFNESPPEALWKEGIARSRAGGLILGGMTSLLDNIWVVDGILGKADGKAIRVRYGSSCENCAEHGRNGNLAHEHIERILAQYDPDEREARFSGRPLSVSGRILKTFDRAVHVAKEDITPPMGAEVSHGMIVDPAIGKPLAVVWRFVDKSGVLNYYDESPDFDFEGAMDSNLTVRDYVLLFKAREAGRRIDTRILDRHFGNVRRTLGGPTLKQEFAAVGDAEDIKYEMLFQDSYTMDPGVEVETGILKIKEYLRYDKAKPIDALNRPRIRISPKCRNLIAAMERWSRDVKTGKPCEEYKDFCDLVRYDVMSEPSVDAAANWVTINRGTFGVGNG